MFSTIPKEVFFHAIIPYVDIGTLSNIRTLHPLIFRRWKIYLPKVILDREPYLYAIENDDSELLQELLDLSSIRHGVHIFSNSCGIPMRIRDLVKLSAVERSIDCLKVLQPLAEKFTKYLAESRPLCALRLDVDLRKVYRKFLSSHRKISVTLSFIDDLDELFEFLEEFGPTDDLCDRHLYILCEVLKIRGEKDVAQELRLFTETEWCEGYICLFPEEQAILDLHDSPPEDVQHFREYLQKVDEHCEMEHYSPDIIQDLLFCNGEKFERTFTKLSEISNESLENSLCSIVQSPILSEREWIIIEEYLTRRDNFGDLYCEAVIQSACIYSNEIYILAAIVSRPKLLEIPDLFKLVADYYTDMYDETCNVYDDLKEILGDVPEALEQRWRRYI